VYIKVTGRDGSNSSGSGFVIDRTSLVTNFHVIEGAAKAFVRFKDEEREIEVLGFKAVLPGRDLAILAVDVPEKSPILPIAKAIPIKGEDVITVGAPRGFELSVTKGIVSALRTGDEMRRSMGSVEGRFIWDLMGLDVDSQWIQTDAVIDHGNSGGPLLNGRGEVVGVNTLLIPGARNLNFAVGAPEMLRVVAQADRHGKVQPFAALPARERPPLIVNRPRPGTMDAERRLRIRAALDTIDRERLVLFRRKEVVDARIAEDNKLIAAAKAECDRLAADAATALQAWRQVQVQGAQIEQRLAIETNAILRADYQNQLVQLAAEGRSLEIAYNRLAAAASRVQATVASYSRDLQAAGNELVSIYSEADALRYEFFKAIDIGGTLASGDVDAILETLAEWIIRDRDNAYAYSIRAIVYANVGRYSEAVADANRVAALNLGSGLTRFTLGYVYFRRGDAKQAIAEFNLAAQSAPKDAQVYLYRGLAYLKVASYDKAIEDLKRAIQFAPAWWIPHVELARVYAASSFDHRRNPAKAVELATKAVSLTESNNWECLDVLAMAYAEAGKFPEAIATVKRAIPMAPESERAAAGARLKLYEAGQPFRVPR